MAELTNEERETHLNMTADDRSTWVVFSDDPVMQRRLEAVGAELTDQSNDYGHGKFYKLPANQLSFRKPPKPMSAARKAQLAARLAAARANA